MTFYVYAITDRPDEPLPGRPGLQDTELAQVVWRDIGAVVSAHGGLVQPANADDLWRHEEVIESLMIRRTVLPARFGTLLSRQQLDDMLCRAYPQVVQDLERVRGHVEIGVRFFAIAESETTANTAPRGGIAAAACSASDHAPSGPPKGLAKSGPASGTAYLLTKLAKERGLRNRRQMRLKMAHEVFAMLTDLASAGRLDDEPNDRHVVSAAFLVPRECVFSFQQSVSRVADAHPELALLCTGPWPPYSFVSTSVNPGAQSSPQHIARLERAGQFPERPQVGQNRVAWLNSEIEKWIDDRAVHQLLAGDASNNLGAR